MIQALYDQVQAKSQVLKLQAELKKVRIKKASLEKDPEVIVLRTKKLEIDLTKTKKTVVQLRKEL